MPNRDFERDLPAYSPSQKVTDMMAQQRILGEDETPQQMLARVVDTLFEPEEKFGSSKVVVEKLRLQFASYIVDGYVMPGTPTLTNAGRNLDSALSSCVVIPVNLNDRIDSARRIKSYYAQNMGSGFDLNPYSDPVALLKWINDLSATESATGKYDRYIGNMGSLHVSHPRIVDFVEAKKIDGEIPHFNISVDLSDDFMASVKGGNRFVVQNGRSLDARGLFRLMAENAWVSGDPGILFLDRMNYDNPVVSMGRYVSTPPCGEMGLAEGETCQFAYLNLSRFVENGIMDYSKLEEVTKLTVRVLDNAIEQSIGKYPDVTSSTIASHKRKIGVGVCGLADMFIKCGVSYDSPEGRALARDILSYINFTTKEASVDLAQDRGSCLAMGDIGGNRYYTEQFLKRKFGDRSTNTVSAKQWVKLSDHIIRTGRLRNILTTSLPPTGRASVILGVTSAIEPIFTIFEEGDVKQDIYDLLVRSNVGGSKEILEQAKARRSFQRLNGLPNNIRDMLKTALEVSIKGHLAMVADLSGVKGVFDESASKTVNLPRSSSVDDVERVFMQAYDLGLKNVSVYRDGSKDRQPEKL